MRPGRHYAGSGIWRGRKYGSLLTDSAGELAFASQTVIYLHHLNTPNTVTLLPVLGPHPELSVLHYPTQSSVYTKKHTANLTEHSPAVKLCKIHVVQLLFYWQSQFNVLHHSRVSNFCMEFENLAKHLVNRISGKSLNLLHPTVRF